MIYCLSGYIWPDLVKGGVAVGAVVVLTVRLTVLLLSMYPLLPQLVFFKFAN